MDHVAIMKKSWGLTQRILEGKKTIETRRYMNKSVPWDKIHTNDTVYFKDSGSPITVQATVAKVEQFSDLDEKKIKNILTTYNYADIGTNEIMPEVLAYAKEKKYCIIIHLKNPRSITPFEIDKSGYGMMSARICVDDIKKIRLYYVLDFIFLFYIVGLRCFYV